MGFVDAVRSGFANFTTWQGRSSRSEYWWWALFSIICAIGAVVIDNVLGTTFTMADPLTGVEQAAPYGWVYMLVALVLFLPGLAVLVRRLHDTGRSGWWYWIALVPIVGAILLLVWFCSRGTVGNNEYGPDPLGGGEAATFN